MPEQEKFEILTGIDLEILTIIWGEPSYGLSILEKISDASDEKRKLNFGTLYPKLHKLKRKGYIKVYEMPPEDKPLENNNKSTAPRKYYALTPEGKSIVENTWRYLSDLSSKKELIKAYKLVTEVSFNDHQKCGRTH